MKIKNLKLLYFVVFLNIFMKNLEYHKNYVLKFSI